MMRERKAAEALTAALEASGRRCALFPVGRLLALKDEFEGLRQRGTIGPRLQQNWLAGLTFEPPAQLPGARSVVVVATPCPLDRFTFDLGARELKALVPPSYLHGARERDLIEEMLSDALRPWGHSVVEAVVPKKRIAAESGLARYGRNNITYVKGMGSFLRLDAYFSDLPCDSGNWKEAEMLERCRSCRACTESCPTRAIPRDRFVLRAERCISFHNEEANDVPFPDWMEPSVHHCLVGCMRCQTVCPENTGLVSWVREGERFDSNETELLAKGVPFKELPQATAEKLERSNLTELMESLARNLRALLDGENAIDRASEEATRIGRQT